MTTPSNFQDDSNQQVPDIFPNHPHGQLAQSREQKLEQATITKQKTLDNVSALKKASIEQTSDKVAASLDPESQKQYDLDNLDLVNYRLKGYLLQEYLS